jgi:hypothetical protein
MRNIILSWNNPNPDPNIEDVPHYAPDAFLRLSGGGQTTQGDTLTITIFNSSLWNGQESVSYTTNQNDSTATVAAALAIAIDNDANCQQAAISAFSTGPTVVFRNVSGTATASETGANGGGATELITFTPDSTYPADTDATVSTTLSGTSASAFYIFQNASDYNNANSSNHDPTFPFPNTPPNTLAQNQFAATPYNVGWSAIFYTALNGTTESNPSNTVSHEAGHQLDRLYQPILGSATPYASGGLTFSSALQADMNWWNASSGCSFSLNYPPPLTNKYYPGVFSYMLDQWGQQICGTDDSYANADQPWAVAPGDGTALSSNKPGSGPNSNQSYAQICGSPATSTCNWDVLVAAFPDIFNPLGDFNQFRQNGEIFAELFATNMAEYNDYSQFNGTVHYGYDVVFGTWWPSSTETNVTPGYGASWNSPFACTSALVDSLAASGTNADLSRVSRQILTSTFPTTNGCN